MTIEGIEKFIKTKTREGAPVNIHFKERSTITGLFISGRDYEDLKEKNFWRIVSSTFLEEWQKTQNGDLARIYNGNVFTKLTDPK